MVVSVPPIHHPKVRSARCDIEPPDGDFGRVPHWHHYCGPDGRVVQTYVDESGCVQVSESLWHTIMTDKFGAVLVVGGDPCGTGRMGDPAPGEGAPQEG